MSKFYSVKAVLAALAIVVASICAPASFAQAQVTLKAGTPVVLVTVDNVSSKNVVSGSVIDFKVASDVISEGKVVIPAGTIAKGQVSNVSKASALGKGGELSVSINTINAVDGTLVPLSGATVSASGKDKVGLAVVCGLCTLVGFLIHGEQAEVPAGAQAQAVVMSNTGITL